MLHMIVAGTQEYSSVIAYRATSPWLIGITTQIKTRTEWSHPRLSHARHKIYIRQSEHARLARRVAREMWCRAPLRHDGSRKIMRALHLADLWSAFSCESLVAENDILKWGGSGHKFCKLSGNEENGRKVRECEAGTGRFVSAGSHQVRHKCAAKQNHEYSNPSFKNWSLSLILNMFSRRRLLMYLYCCTSTS